MKLNSTPLESLKKRSKKKSFLSFFEKRIKHFQECARYGTALNYNRAKSSLEKYLNGKVLYFQDLTPQFITAYEEWLQNKGLKRNSISFHMRILRAVYNNAVKKKICRQQSPFSQTYTGVDKTRKRVIGVDLIKTLRKIDLKENPELSLARDMFLFSVFTRGMAFVDMAFLRKSDINNKELTYTRKKSNSILKIKVEKEIKEIISRYEKLYPQSPFIFPILTECSPSECHKIYLNALGLYNHRLKKIASLAGIPASISSYSARHTWASLAYKMEVPISVISAGLGHTSEKTTRIYLESLDNSSIDKANKKLIKKLLG